MDVLTMIKQGDPKLKAAFILGFQAGLSAKRPRSASARTWVAGMVRWATLSLTGGFFNPVDAWQFDAEFNKAFRETAVNQRTDAISP